MASAGPGTAESASAINLAIRWPVSEGLTVLLSRAGLTSRLSKCADGVWVWTDSSVFRPAASEIFQDLSKSIVVAAVQATSLITSQLAVGYHTSRLISKGVLIALPFLQPTMTKLYHEFLGFPFERKLVLIGTLLINLLLFEAWRRRYLEKLHKSISKAHHRIADFLQSIGPYLTIILLLYAPLKNTLPQHTFVSSTKILSIVVICLHSVGTSLQLLRYKGQDDSRLKSDLEDSSRGVMSDRTPLRSRISPWARVLRTPRQDGGSVATYSRLHKAVVIQLSFFVTVAVLQLVLLPLESLAGLLVPIPTFNVWRFSYDRIPIWQRSCASAQMVKPAVDLILRRDVGPIQWALRRLVWGFLTLEELCFLTLVVSVVIQDKRFASWYRRKAAKVVDFILARCLGLPISLRQPKPAGDATPPLMDSPSPTRLGRWQSAVFGVGGFLADGWYSRLSSVVHLLPLSALILPTILVRVVFLLVGFVLPIVYGLLSLNPSRKSAKNGGPKMGYWLFYFSSMIWLVVLTDLLILSTPLASWFLSSIRFKLLAVVLTQFISTEPKTLGLWVAKQATKVSVSAIQTARRYPHTKSPPPERKRASLPPEPFRESVERMTADDRRDGPERRELDKPESPIMVKKPILDEEGMTSTEITARTVDETARLRKRRGEFLRDDERRADGRREDERREDGRWDDGRRNVLRRGDSQRDEPRHDRSKEFQRGESMRHERGQKGRWSEYPMNSSSGEGNMEEERTLERRKSRRRRREPKSSSLEVSESSSIGPNPKTRTRSTTPLRVQRDFAPSLVRK